VCLWKIIALIVGIIERTTRHLVAEQIVIFLIAIVMNLENRKHPSYDDLRDPLMRNLKGYNIK
jgi:hypothetical protein